MRTSACGVVALGTALVFVLQRLHRVKWKYLADTLTVIDFRMVMNRANYLVLHLYPYIAVFIVLCVTGLALSWILMRTSRRSTGQRAGPLGACDGNRSAGTLAQQKASASGARRSSTTTSAAERMFIGRRS